VPICRNGPKGASHKWGLSPFSSEEGLSIAGVVLNHPRPPSADDASLSSNRRELAARCTPPILGEVGWDADQTDDAVDWFALAR
ncbi:MAG: hypothetical protein K8R46_02490, partial [Pirellulales bacterium]|nr:hypothetical protein [Pirellulales bacterium]